MRNKLLSNTTFWLILIFLLSVPVKLTAAHNLGWDVDVAVVIARGMDWLNGGAFPAYGTLSSVAAYNMPFLIWMHLPVMLFTHNAWLVMVITLMLWNAIGTFYVYRTGTALFSPRAGLIAAALFTFSETGVSSAYTSWAQVTLATFFIMVFYHLWQWHQTRRGAHLAFAIVVATTAFMTHFAAIMLFPAMLIFALLTRTRPPLRALFAGCFISIALVTPYLLFEAPRNFNDLKSFLARRTNIPAEVMAQYESLKPGYSVPVEATDTAPQVNPDTPPESQPVSANAPAPSRIERIIQFVLSVPGQMIQALWLFTQNNFVALPIFSLLMLIAAIVYGVVIICAPLVLPMSQTVTRSEYENARRIALILAFVLVFCAGLIVTRASPTAQMTYYTGLVSLQWLIVAGGFDSLFHLDAKALRILIPFVLLFMVGNSAERIARVVQHDDAAFSRYNIALYRHIEAATDFIAADWNRPDAVNVSYDILPEMDNLWWVMPWHTVDALYRMGTPFDLLLEWNHGLINQNQSAEGVAENADYIVVYTPGLERYDLTQYQVTQFGAIYILKPVMRDDGAAAAAPG